MSSSIRGLFITCIVLVAGITASHTNAAIGPLQWWSNVDGGHSIFGGGMELEDYIVFTPTDFSAGTGNGYDVNHGQLTIGMDTGFGDYRVITGISVFLKGTGHLIGGSGGFTRASGAVTLREDTPLVDRIVEDFSTLDLTGNDDEWEASFHLTPVLTRDPLLLTIDIDLLAFAAGLTEFAWISADLIAIKVDIGQSVPLPAGLPLFGTALLLLAGRVIKRKVTHKAA